MRPPSTRPSFPGASGLGSGSVIPIYPPPEYVLFACVPQEAYASLRLTRVLLQPSTCGRLVLRCYQQKVEGR